MKIENDAVLNTHLQAVLAGPAMLKGNVEWASKVEAFIAIVKADTPERLTDRAFLRHLWNAQALSKTGNGHVNIEPALESPEFVQWFATHFCAPLPDDPVSAQRTLVSLYNELSERMRTLCKRTPRLKLNRVMCAFFPEHFTTIADVGRLTELHRELGEDPKDHPVQMHQRIRARIDTALESIGTPVSAPLRLCLPWLLYRKINATIDRVEDHPVEPTELGLSPLPAAQRRKGLTPFGGGFPSVLGVLAELNEGVTSGELSDILRLLSPDAGDRAILSAKNVIVRELDICKREGDLYLPNARGLNLLTTQEPDDLADYLLTQILGIDHVIDHLRNDPCTRSELIALLQEVHPGWTSPAVPYSILNWLVSMEVVQQDSAKRLNLNERGRRWAEMITWTPEKLSKGLVILDEPSLASDRESLILPVWPDLFARLKQRAALQHVVFDQQLVSQLHAGLWSHPLRHFAVLTGISGSGKTQLALQYAHALCNSSSEQPPNIKIIPVQPGWYDSGALLGYVNPLSDSAYRSTPFLDLLMQACEDPQTPYVVILDEMNLSHPEQYLAPILSAMETGGELDLHKLGDDTLHIPESLLYPANLAIIGTVNMDETTHGLSDKVLDRAYTLEFWKIDVNAFPGWKTPDLPAEHLEKLKQVMGSLVKALEPVRLHFGWRTINDAINYLSFHHQSKMPLDSALDDVIYAKVLPKIRGEGTAPFQTALSEVLECLKTHGLSRCADKISNMQNDVQVTGSARFWR